MKRILVLVAGESNLPFILAAKKLGVYVITCDNNPSNPGHKIADENIFIDVYDHTSIVEAIKDKDIDGVMSFVSPHGLNTASIISEHFHLKGFTQSASSTLMDKGLFRNFLTRNNFNSPIYQCVQNLDEVVLEELTYPIIIKPTDSGGSQGVIKINNENELYLNFQISKGFSNSGKVIIEEFLEGDAFINGDCLIYNEEIIFEMIGNYIYDDKTNKVLPIATVFPAEDDISESLKQVSDIVKALKIPDGIINFEAIIKNKIPYIVEINPRPSGNNIWKLMGYQYSIDIPNLLINIYLDSYIHKHNIEESNNHSYAYQLVYSDKNKLFNGFEMPLSIKSNLLEMNIFKQKDEPICAFNNLYNRIGIILMEFKDEKIRKFYIENTDLFRI